MKLVRGAWKLLVGIKDALVLIAMLLFFAVLFAALNARPNPARLGEGALVLDLAGSVVEQPSVQDPLAALSGGDVVREHRLRDLVRMLDAARTDARVKAVVLDLDRFTGGYPAHVSELGRAIGRVRAGGKPVLAYATAYTDAGYLLAAHASEIWVDPLGGTLFAGPGGSRLYYKGLIDRLGVTAHIYRVGTYKSAVEPYERADASPPARAADEALYGSLLDQWRTNVAQARPKARIDAFLTRPEAAIAASGGDIARANLNAGLVDKLGDRLAFGQRVAGIVGRDPAKPVGSFRALRMTDYLTAHPLAAAGSAIGVLTIAGEIVDGEASPGSAGGDSIVKLLLDGLAKNDLKALVIRVDSPGGSVLAVEKMRQAILQAKARGLPVVVSMGGLAASAGYYVAMPADVIFAEPNTITGSIGVFGVLPTFENALPKIGLTADGVRTTPLSGQPDLLRGTNAPFEAIMQAGVEQFYRRFIAIVAQSRRMTPARVDSVAQGRVWDGGTARQLGLVDRFGTLEDAITEAARRAKLKRPDVHPRFLEPEPGWAQRFAETFAPAGDDEAAPDLATRLAGDRRMLAARALGDARRLMTAPTALRASCLECASLGPPRASAAELSLLDRLMAGLIG